MRIDNKHFYAFNIYNAYCNSKNKNKTCPTIVSSQLRQNDTLEVSEDGKLKLKLRNLERMGRMQDEKQQHINDIKYTSQTLGAINSVLEDMKKRIEDNLRWYSSYIEGLDNGTIKPDTSFEKYSFSMSMEENFPDYKAEADLEGLKMDICSDEPTQMKSNDELKKEAFTQVTKNIQSTIEVFSKTISEFIGNAFENAPNTINIFNQATGDCKSIDEIKSMFTGFAAKASDFNNVKDSIEFSAKLKETLGDLSDIQNNLLDASYKVLHQIEKLDSEIWNDIKKKLELGQDTYRKHLSEENTFINKLLFNLQRS